MTPPPGSRPDGTPTAPWSAWTPGIRVVVRRRLSPDDAAASGATVTDVIGVVVASDADTLVLRRDTARRGGTPETVTVRMSEILAGKVVPPRPSPRRSRRLPEVVALPPK